MSNRPFALVLMGPTASGKTELAAALVEQFPLEIISVDSTLVYRGMDIGTAKPDAELLARAPHRLIDILDPAEAYSAARFREDALREMQDICKAGRIPLLVGGTMLYFRALLEGLSELPPADPAIRQALEERAGQRGWEAMHAELEKVDPQAAARIHPNDPQRIQRALEVYELSGKSLSDWIAEPGQTVFPYDVCKIGLLPSDRAVLHDRIAQRFKQMLEQGLVPEVEALYQRGDLDLTKPSMRAVGYRQVWEYLEGKLIYDEMVYRGIVATRQLAKRQFTWLRSENDLHCVDALAGDVHARVLKILGSTPITA